MQKILGLLRKAITDYDMIQPGDRIAVGVSGGKDSVVLLCGMARLREFLGIPFTLHAITLDPCFGGQPNDFSPIEALCASYGIPYTVKRTEIGSIVFDIRQETNPCSLCARMRRGALHDAAKELGCNKIALGHHYDDAIETFIMNLFNEGRVGCFSPVTYLSRKEITMIRPLIYAQEKDIYAALHRLDLPLVPSTCPADKNTNREWTKNFLKQLDKEHHGIKKRIFGAIRRGHISDW